MKINIEFLFLFYQEIKLEKTKQNNLFIALYFFSQINYFV